MSTVMDEAVQASCLEVGRADLAVTRVTEAGLGPPGPGEALFAVERFGFSANNVTYALLGEALRYWDLFPAGPGWGRVPVRGYLRVLASAVPGLSAGRRAFGGPFVTRLRAYDQVLGYDQVGALPAGPATLVDIAGDPALRDAIGQHLGGRGEVVIAGGTHGQTGPLAAGSFSAPQRIRDRALEWGWPVLEQRYRAALDGFAAGAGSWLQIRRHHGLDGAARVYREVLTDASPPAEAHVVEPGG